MFCRKHPKPLSGQEEPNRMSKKEITESVVKGVLWYPGATPMEPEMTTRGVYPKKYPEGAVIHYTASGDSENDIPYGRKMGWCYFFISRSGKVYQPCALDRWGYHAGKSSWPGLGEGVSRRLVGIEVDCAGIVQPDDPSRKLPHQTYTSWFGGKYKSAEVNVCTGKKNIKAGCYHMFSKEQKDALNSLLVWLKKNNPEVFSFDYVLGHDEVAPDRKSDPGGSLGQTMESYRAKLRSIYREGS